MIIIVLQYCSQTVLPSSDGHLGTMLFTLRRTNFFHAFDAKFLEVFVNCFIYLFLLHKLLAILAA